MPAFYATAPGKIILYGEHAVVFGRPAIAVPVTEVKARVSIHADPLVLAGRVHLLSEATGVDTDLEHLPEDHPLRLALLGVIRLVKPVRLPACTIKISSTIPVAAGLGSGAAVSIALIRAFSSFLGKPLPDEHVNDLAYDVEKVHHGTPSGIDNTVIAYAMPVYFVRGQAVETFSVRHPFTMVIADSGIPSLTSSMVGKVRQGWEADRPWYEGIFDRVAELTRQARLAIERGDVHMLGPLMDENHALLVEMGVSSPELDHLVAVARQAGANGAKMSGGGGGGNMIAIVDASLAKNLTSVMINAGAVRVITTLISGTLLG